MTPVIQAVGRLDRCATLFKQREPIRYRRVFCRRRFTSLQQTRLVSQDADRSRRNRYAPLTKHIVTFWRGFFNPWAGTQLAAEALFHGALHLTLGGVGRALTP